MIGQARDFIRHVADVDRRDFELLVQAFSGVQAGSFKDVVVLFIGDQADVDAIKAQLAASGAEVRFVEAK